MSQVARLASMDARMLRAFSRSGIADAATFTSGITSTPCTVMVDDGVQLIGDQSRVLDGKTTVTAQLAEIGVVPVRGDKFTVGTRVLLVDGIADKDESIVICVIKDGC